jgi:hypothetical protein
MPEGYCMAAVRRRNPHPVAAYYEAIETDPSHYFRMTMALIDLHAIRNDIHFMEKRTWFIEERLAEINKLIPLPEQSLFNYFFSKKCLKLDVLVAAVPERLDFSKRTILDIKGWNNDTPLSFFYWAFLLGGPWRGQGKRNFHLLKVEYRIKAFVNRLLARLNFKRNRS